MFLFSFDSYFIRIVCCWQCLLNQCFSNGIIIQLTCLAKLLQRKNVMVSLFYFRADVFSSHISVYKASLTHCLYMKSPIHTNDPLLDCS